MAQALNEMRPVERWWPVNPSILAGLVVLAVLMLPDATLLDVSAHLPQPLTDPQTLTNLVTLPAALVVGAWLLQSGLAHYQMRKSAGLEAAALSPAARQHTGRVAAVALLLSALIHVTALHSFYWFMVWDTTVDSLGSFWLAFPMLAVLVGAMLILVSGQARWAGFVYLLLIPALAVVAGRAQSVNYRQLTQARAEQARQAIEAYHAREGRYPQELQQLIPFYSLSLPGPVIIFGQDWCYRGGPDYYRLGYLDRDHWSSPILFGRLYAASGHSPLRADVCQPVIDRYRAEHPGWDRDLQVYGKPTPTPDLGE